MRIRELLEGKHFKEADFVSPKEEGGREINYDLVEDLIHFMTENDMIYRRYVFPSIAKFSDLKEAHKEPKPSTFEQTVKESYKAYVKEFPIRELPDEIDEDICKQVCDKMYEQVSQHYADGVYKD